MRWLAIALGTFCQGDRTLKNPTFRLENEVVGDRAGDFLPRRSHAGIYAVGK